MKKFLVLVLALTMAIGLAACSSKNDSKPEKKETPKETAVDKEKNVKKQMVKFYMDLADKINAKDADLNAYESAAAKAAADPTKKVDPELKAKAAAAAAAVVAELNNIQIPADLNDQKADLEGALKDYTASYQAKADELKKDAPSLDAADASFASGEEKLGKAFVSAKLGAPTLGKQVN